MTRSMAENRTRNAGSARSASAYGAYNYGSAARQLQPAREDRQRTRRLEERRSARAAHRQTQALTMDFPYLMMLTFAVMVTLAILCSYIRVQSSIATSLRAIETQEKTLEALKSENDALQTAINTNIDLDHIYQVATQELGMVYADRHQVIRYQKTESEYVRQYEDIPGDAAR